MKANGKISDSDESWTVVPEKWGEKSQKLAHSIWSCPGPQGWMGLPCSRTPGLLFSCILTGRGVFSPLAPAALIARDKEECIKEKEA